jgi:hypothetical protein
VKTVGKFGSCFECYDISEIWILKSTDDVLFWPPRADTQTTPNFT